MRSLHGFRGAVTSVAVAMLLALGAAAFAHVRALAVSPEDGARLSGPVRTLRVWFDQEPDLERSQLELTGPNGPLSVEGLHTMGEKDLMARVSGRMPDGSYTATWRTAGEDGHLRTGEWTFTIERDGR